MSNQKKYDSALFSELKKSKKADIYTLAAHVFTGDHKTARGLGANLEDLSARDQAFANFHLGLSLTRTSSYKKASELFKTNLKIFENNPKDPEIGFLVYQGLGFFNWFFSRHRQSLRAVHEAHKNLLLIEGQKPLYEILCSDLEGHNLVHRARIHQGIQVLETALQTAENENINSFAQSLRFSVLIYRNRFLNPPDKAIDQLLEAFQGLSSTDDYSKSELIFEISNLMMLMGQFQRAKDFLNSHFETVYQNDNKRQMGQLNFRLTYNMFRHGAFEQALYMAKSARANLKPVTDKGLICQILGLEIKVLKAMGKSTQTLEGQLRELDQKIDDLLVKRSNARVFENRHPFNKGEDPAGDVVDRMSPEKPAPGYQELIEKKMYGLLGDLFSIPAGQSTILLGAPKNHTIVLTTSENRVIEKPLGKILTLVLRAIANQQGSKEELISKVWGYDEYSPLRHDPLIYSSIARLRGLLNLNEDQIFFDGEKYFLRLELVDLVVKKRNLQKKITSTSSQNVHLIKDSFVSELDPSLNFRQIEMLQDRQFKAVSVKEYATKFQITTMTALRDMQKLCQLGYLKKTGQGRATRYLKTMKISDQ
ncbi:MAG: hypothetical protein AAF203_01885 [Pseudomonadota bacterium]